VAVGSSVPLVMVVGLPVPSPSPSSVPAAASIPTSPSSVSVGGDYGVRKLIYIANIPSCIACAYHFLVPCGGAGYVVALFFGALFPFLCV